MLRIAIAVLVLAAASVSMGRPAAAQWGPLWDDDPYPYRSPYYRNAPGDFWGEDMRPRRPAPPATRSGGPRPAISPIPPELLSFPSTYPVGSIIIDHKGRQLLLITSPTQALRYPISVGREGFGWAGTQRISKMVDWPSWYPPADMRERDPRLPVHMTGGIRNPLGAKALYLGNTLYRIHGTNDPKSIGRASSSGCFRMLNGHVLDLASRVGVGTTVTVVRRLPPALERTIAVQMAGGMPPGFGVDAPAARPSYVGPGAPPPGFDDDEPFEDEPFDDGPAGEGAGGAPPQGRPY